MKRSAFLLPGLLWLVLASGVNASTTTKLPDPIPPAASPSAPASTVDLGDARRQSQAGDFPAANRLFEQYIAKNPKDATACAKLRTDEFSRLFPKEDKPRRSLPEEVAGLRALGNMAEAMATTESAGTKPENAAKWGPALTTLADLDRDGLLEPYALFQRADQELAQDYVAYRAATKTPKRLRPDRNVIY